MTTNLTRFNNQMDALVNSLLRIEKIKDDKSIHLFQLKLQGITALDSKKPLECFLKYVYPYKDQIMNKDEDFFLGGKINERVTELCTNLKQEEEVVIVEKKDDEFVLHQALHIQNHWNNNLNEAQRNAIWTYFQVLIKLAERYVAEKVNLSGM